MNLNKLSTKVLCSMLLVILIIGSETFFALASDKNVFTNASFYTTNNNFSIVNSSYANEEVCTSENYSIYIHKKLSLFLSNQYAPKEDLPYSRDLLSFFPKKVNTQLHFQGYAEYAHSLTINKIDFTSSVASVILSGSMMDAYSSETREIDVKYVVSNNSVNEYVTVTHEDKSKEQTLNSIIPNQTILKLPLKIDNSWKQKFHYKGTEYEATTSITSVKAENNLTRCTTTTIVNNIKGYLNNTYREERTYEEGKGLIFFSVSTPLNGSFPYAVFENNTFSYILDQYIEKK